MSLSELRNATRPFGWQPCGGTYIVAVTTSLQVRNVGNNEEMGPSLALLLQPSMEEYGFVICTKKEW